MNIRKEIIKIVKENGFLTGSRRFGVSTEDSDWDYVVLFYDFRKCLKKKGIELQFNNPNIEPNIPYFLKTDIDTYGKEKYFRSYRINYKEKAYNILMVWNKVEFKVWEIATRIFTSQLLSPLYRIENKKKRVKLFRNIKETQREYLLSRRRNRS